MNQQKIRKTTSLNFRAISIVIGIVLAIIIGNVLGNPFLSYNKEWIETANYHATNNTTWNNMTKSQRTAFILFPVFLNSPFWIPTIILYLNRRKMLYINGMKEGKVTFMFGITRNSILYDLACIIRGFKHQKWYELPRPVSLEKYNGMMIIYYKPRFFTLPWDWSRIRIEELKQVMIGFKSVWVEGKYHHLEKDDIQPVNSYIYLMNTRPFVNEMPDLETFQLTHKQTLKRIQKDNTEMLQSRNLHQYPIMH